MRTITILFLLIPFLSFGNPSDSIVNKELVLINIANLSRTEIARVIEEVEKRNPKVVGIDAWFTYPKDKDSLLLPVLYRYRNNLVIGVKLTECVNGKCDSLTGNYFPYPKEGHVMVSYKNLRYDPLLVHGKKIYPFFCLALLKEYDSSLVKNFFIRQLHKQPLTFYGNYTSFVTLEGKELLTPEFSGECDLQNKIVILGYLGKKIGHVKKRKPVDYKRSNLSNGQLPDMYGVVLLANILTDIMNKAR